jgi:hypothetical protein
MPQTNTAEKAMDGNRPADLRHLHDQLDAAERDAQALVAALVRRQLERAEGGLLRSGAFGWLPTIAQRGRRFG